MFYPGLAFFTYTDIPDVLNFPNTSFGISARLTRAGTIPWPQMRFLLRDGGLKMEENEKAIGCKPQANSLQKPLAGMVGKGIGIADVFHHGCRIAMARNFHYFVQTGMVGSGTGNKAGTQ